MTAAWTGVLEITASFDTWSLFENVTADLKNLSEETERDGLTYGEIRLIFGKVSKSFFLDDERGIVGDSLLLPTVSFPLLAGGCRIRGGLRRARRNMSRSSSSTSIMLTMDTPTNSPSEPPRLLSSVSHCGERRSYCGNE